MKKSNLLGALKDVSNAAPVPAPAEAMKPQTAKPAKAGQGTTSRDGKEPMTNWLNPQFKQNLMMLKAMRSAEKVSIEALTAEGLNLLFEKYNLPTVRDE